MVPAVKFHSEHEPFFRTGTQCDAYDMSMCDNRIFWVKYINKIRRTRYSLVAWEPWEANLWYYKAPPIHARGSFRRLPT